jgi:hypothetical protein
MCSSGSMEGLSVETVARAGKRQISNKYFKNIVSIIPTCICGGIGLTTYTDRVDIRCMPKKRLFGLVVTQIPQPARLVHAASYVGAGVRRQRDGNHIPCVGLKL